MLALICKTIFFFVKYFGTVSAGKHFKFLKYFNEMFLENLFLYSEIFQKAFRNIAYRMENF